MNSDSKKLNDFDQLVLCHLISNIKVESEKDYLFIISELIKDNTNLNVDSIDLYLDVKESEEEFQAFLDAEILNQIKEDEDTITLNLEVDAEEGLKTLEKIKRSLDDIDARCESNNESNEAIDPLLLAKKRLQDTLNSEMDEEEGEHLYQAFRKSFPDLFSSTLSDKSSSLNPLLIPDFESALLYQFPILKGLEDWKEKMYQLKENKGSAVPELAPRYLYSKGIDWTLEDIKKQLNKLEEGEKK